MVSSENLLDDNVNTQQQFKILIGNKSHQHHHIARKTGSIFSNPFKNGNLIIDLFFFNFLNFIILFFFAKFRKREDGSID